MKFVDEMQKFTLHYFAEDTGACKIAIAAELTGVAVSLNRIHSRESGMNVFSNIQLPLPACLYCLKYSMSYHIE